MIDVYVPMESKTTLNQYDDFGKRIKVISPDTGTTIYSHDEAGNIIQKGKHLGSHLQN